MSVLYHVGIPTDVTPPAVLLVSPDVELQAVLRACGNTRVLGENREYRSCIATDGAYPVLVTTVGHGGPPLAIAVEELARAGARAFMLLDRPVRSYSAASIIAVQAAVRREGTSRHYAPSGFPAVPDPDFLAALSDSLPSQALVGIVHTTDVSIPTEAELPACLAVDRRSATHFVVGAARGVRTACVLVDEPDDVEAVTRAALAALHRMPHGGDRHGA